MAITKSTQVTNAEMKPPVMNNPGGVYYPIPWDYTVADAALVNTDVVYAVKIPGGCKVNMHESWHKMNFGTGANTELDYGYLAYKKSDGTVEPADPDGLVDGYTGSATVLTAFTSETLGAKADVAGMYGWADFSDAVEDVTITITCLNAGGTFDGDIGDVWNGVLKVQAS